MFAVYALVAAVTGTILMPVHTEPITPSHFTQSVYILQIAPGSPPLELVNHGAAGAHVTVAATAGGDRLVQSIRLSADEPVAIASLLPSDWSGTLMIDGNVDLIRPETGDVILRRSLMSERDAMAILRGKRDPAPFFVANVSPLPIRIEIEAEGSNSAVEVSAYQLAEIADLFAGLPPTAQTAVIRASTPGALFFAGLLSPRYRGGTLESPSLPGKRHRAVIPPGQIPLCDTVIERLKAARKDLDELAGKAVEVPSPPALTTGCTFDQYDAARRAYAASILEPESTIADRIAQCYKDAFLRDGCGLPDSAIEDINAVVDQFQRKETALKKLGDPQGAEPLHWAIIGAFTKIERRATILGSTADLVPVTDLTSWMARDEKMLLDRITNEHDYPSADVAKLWLRDMQLFGLNTSTDFPDKLTKALTFKLKLAFDANVTGNAGGIYEGHSGGEATFSLDSSDLSYRKFVDITMKILSAKRWNNDVGWCTVAAGPGQGVAEVNFNFCGSQPFQITVTGDLGGSFQGTMTCPTKVPMLTGSELTGVIKVAFANNGNLSQVLNQPFLHDAEFHNGSPTPVDESWDLLTKNTEVVAKVTVTHEPAK